MIKRILVLALLAGGIALNAHAQCIPDVTITDPGIYPDSATGLPAGTVGVTYNEVIQFKVLTDTSLAGLPVTVDSISITQVTGLPPGISYTCTPASCVFPGGSNGCILLTGTPTVSGAFPLTVDLIIDANLSGIAFQQPSTVDYYVININAATGIATLSSVNFGIVNVLPNPAADYTDLTYSTPLGGDFRITLYDMIGKKVSEQLIRGLPGNNTFRIKTAQLKSGVYMLTLGNGSSVATRKVVVSKR